MLLKGIIIILMSFEATIFVVCYGGNIGIAYKHDKQQEEEMKASLIPKISINFDKNCDI